MSTFLIISLQFSIFFPSCNPRELNTKPSSSTDIKPSLSLSNTSKASFKSSSPPSLLSIPRNFGEQKMEVAEYFSKDFEWEELKAEVENDPSFRYHLLPFECSNPSSQAAAEEDSIAWKKFHIRHSSGKFFKERRYLLKEFPELVSCGECSKVLEVGCGNGSTALPILRGNEHIIVYACDCSSETLEKAEEIIDAATVASLRHRFCTFNCDFSITGFPKWLACHTCREVFMQKPQNCLSDAKENPRTMYPLNEVGCCIGGVDFITLIFTLSAVPFQRMPTSIKECFSVIKPGGMLLFRDYG